MASYNHGAFVGQAIESVLAQSYQNLELVITDDGSKDQTPEVIRGIRDDRIVFNAFLENRGACAAINDAIRRSRGEYIAVLNSDDYFLPGKIATQVQFMEERPDACAVFGLPFFVNEAGDKVINNHPMLNLFARENKSSNEWLRHFFWKGNCLCHPTVMVRKSLYESVGMFDVSLRQLPDLDLWIRACIESAIHILPEPLTAFRLMNGEGNTSAPNLRNQVRHEWELMRVLERYLVLPEERLAQIFKEDCAEDFTVMPAYELLAKLAFEVGSPGYNGFALNALREVVLKTGGANSAEYFSHIEKANPLGVRLGARAQALSVFRRALNLVSRTRGY